ncbi:hypothetical protein [Nocardioides sp.]|uniref:hypothetical protein n=1 Tax=Nocardioides sp. TaxID=35761 RepID=UPI00321933F0
MAGRLVGAFLGLVMLAAAGAGAGYLVGREDVEEPVTFAVPEAVPAEQPSFPVNVYDVTPDPDATPLDGGLALHEEKFRAGGFKLRAPAPDGWQRVELSGRTQWNFTPADRVPNTYLLRIGIVAGERKSPSVETTSRIFALRQQETDGNSENLIIEEQSDSAFTATTIVGGYQRVIMERFLTAPGNSSAYFTVVMNGREVDRDAMTELIDRVVAGAFVPGTD